MVGDFPPLGIPNATLVKPPITAVAGAATVAAPPPPPPPLPP